MEDDFEEPENSQKRSVKKWTEEEVSLGTLCMTTVVLYCIVVVGLS